MLIKGRVGHRCALATRSWRAVWRLALWASASALGATCCAQPVQVAWTPSQLSALELWYDASDASSVSYSTVSQQIELWRDKSGKGRDAAQASGSNQPRYNQATLNGLQVVRFDGDDRLLADVPAGTFPSSFHVIAVFYRWGDVLSTTSGPLARNIGLNAAPFDMYNSRRHIGNGSSYTIVSNTATSTYNMTSPTILACSATGSSYHEHLNGTLRVSTTGSYNYSDAAPNVVLASNNSGTNLRGDIAEVCAISSLDDADRQRLEGYLAHKWGLTANLPTGHPYKTAAPLADVSPLVHWKLDETSGTTFANSGTLGTAANASLSGAATLGQPSLPVDNGKAAALRQAEISPGDVNGLNSSQTFAQRTIEAWFRVDATAGRQMICGAGGTQNSYSIYLDQDTLYMTACHRDDSGPGSPWGGSSSVPPVSLVCPTPILPNVTYHVAMVIDGNDACSGTLTGYLNGASFGTASGVGKTYEHSAFRIGNSGNRRLHDNQLSGKELFLYGTIDDVKVWDAALPASYFADVYRIQWGLVGHWKFDETNGTIAYDYSGLGNHGNVVGTVPRENDGARSGAYRFSSGTEHVYVPPSSTLDAIAANNGDFALAMWVKPHGLTAGWRSVFKRGLRTGSAYSRHPALWLHPSNNRIHYRISTTTNINSGGDSTLQLPNSAWSHLAVVKQGQSYRCFLNGALDSSVTLSGQTYAQSLPIFIGDNPYYGGSNASIDDVRIYTRAITDAEIAELAVSGALLAHWPLDETSGTTAYDVSGNERHATYVGVQLADDAPHPAAGSAPRFDGVTSHVNLGTIDADLSQGCSVALWAKPTGSSTYQRMIQLTQDNQYEGLGIVRNDLNDSWQLFMRSANAQLSLSEYSSDSLQFNRWQHYVATIDAAGYGILYRNGVQVASGNLFPLKNLPRSFCYIGAGNTGLSRNWNGNLADVRLYDYPLTPAEIADIYGLVGWYRCEEASGSVAADSSGKENHAAVVGTAQWGAGLKEGSGALRLDGNSYLRVAQIPLDGPHAAIAGWAKLEAVDGLGADLANLGEHLALRLDEATEGRGTTALAYSGVGYGMASSQRFYEAAGWRHYAAVLDGATGQVTLYLDGVKVATAAAATGLTFNELVSQVTFGAATNGASDYRLKGWVDDLRIYNRPLSSAELRTLYFGRFNPGPRIIQWREVE